MLCKVPEREKGRNSFTCICSGGDTFATDLSAAVSGSVSFAL